MLLLGLVMLLLELVMLLVGLVMLLLGPGMLLLKPVRLHCTHWSHRAILLGLVMLLSGPVRLLSEPVLLLLEPVMLLTEPVLLPKKRIGAPATAHSLEPILHAWVFSMPSPNTNSWSYIEVQMSRDIIYRAGYIAPD